MYIEKEHEIRAYWRLQFRGNRMEARKERRQTLGKEENNSREIQMTKIANTL